MVIQGKVTNARVMLDELDDATRSQIQGFCNDGHFASGGIVVMPDCLHPDTEVLTTRGYVPISSIQIHDKIASFDHTTGRYHFSTPLAKIIRPLSNDEKVYALTSGRLGVLSIQTENHRNAYIPCMGIRGKDIPKRTYVKDFVYGGLYDANDHPVCDELIQFITWVIGDGNVHGNNNKVPSLRIRFGLKKVRKIERVLQLCSALGIVPHVRTTEKQTSIELNTLDSKRVIAIVGVDKEYPIEWIEQLSSRQKILLLQEAIKVDGDFVAYSNGRGFRLNSKRKSDIDFLAAISPDIGTAKVVKRNSVSNFTHKQNEMYYLNILSCSTLYKSKSGIPNSPIEKTEVDPPPFVVCLECDTGFFLYRFRGRTGITGNCHAGAGSCVGFTMPVGEYIHPDIIGVDIGCGMLSACIPHQVIDLPELDDFIKREIPSGFSVNDSALYFDPFYHDTCVRVGADEDRVARSIGTLGGGNHFIEVGVGSGGVYITIHSGSRNFGLQVAKYHGRNGFLKRGSEEFDLYMADMRIAQDYASINRKEMMFLILDKLKAVPQEVIETVHNYIGDDNIIRKGAISAYAGEKVIIPFNMRDGLAICVGKGNSEWNYSAPHGAGRILSRSKAKKELDVDLFVEDMRLAGVYTSTANEGTLDEAPEAYKDTQMIVQAIADTVDIVDMVKPIYNFKSA